MNQSSPAATGTAGAAIAGLVALISMLNTRFNLGLTAQDQVSIAGGIVVGAHWLAQQIAARSTANQGRLLNVQTFKASGAYTPAPPITNVTVSSAGPVAPIAPANPQP
ncbi:hypothetical protein [Paraburkholderia sp.]|jgi:hypothetical protein|uniref:hypothetical protein n=1 Tax=Paraburkholderia sp. TaxID=1926495 RepID=UPI002F3E9745